MINYRENFRRAEENSSDAILPSPDVASGLRSRYGEVGGYAKAGVPPAMPVVAENLFQIIWRGRWLMLLTTILALSAAFIYLLKATPIYTSTSRIFVEQRGPRIIGDLEKGVMTESQNYLYTQVELLKSTPILEAALEAPGIRQMKTFAKVGNQIAYLKGHLQADAGKKDDIINLSFDSPFPAEAAQMVNAVVDCYIAYHGARKRSTAAEVLRILQSEKAKCSAERSEKFKTLMDFKRQHLALSFESEEGNIILQRLERLSDAMTEAQLTTIEAQARYESTKAVVGDPAKLKLFVEAQRDKGVCVSTANERDLLQAALDELQRRRADRLRQLTSNHPLVKALDTEIAQVEKQLAELDVTFGQAQLAVVQEEYTAARQKEAQVSKQFEDQRQEAEDLNENLTQYTLLQSEWEQTKKLCDILDDRIKELDITEDVGALNINILEVAHPATVPSRPQKARILGTALVLAFMLGAGIVLLRDWTDQRLHSFEEISAIIGVPVLGVIPSMSKRKGVTAIAQKAHLDSNSNVAEAYRSIRTAVFFGAPKDGAKTVLITSPSPGDGKTTLVSNLAIAMAQAGQRTLILDADFRKPMQHKIFDINHNNKGISSILTGTATLEEAVYATKVKGLEVLPSGPEVSNPSELLNSEAFAEILQRLSGQYDRIIIDSPPAASSCDESRRGKRVGPVTDSQILAAICDITLLVLRADKSTRNVSQQARDRLLSVGAHIFGIVINGACKRNGLYGYNSDYEWNGLPSQKRFVQAGYYGYDGHKKKKATNKERAIVLESLGVINSKE